MKSIISTRENQKQIPPWFDFVSLIVTCPIILGIELFLNRFREYLFVSLQIASWSIAGDRWFITVSRLPVTSQNDCFHNYNKLLCACSCYYNKWYYIKERKNTDQYCQFFRRIWLKISEWQLGENISPCFIKLTYQN